MASRYVDNFDEKLDSLINELRYGQYMADERGLEFDADEARERMEAHIEKLQTVGTVYTKTDRIITRDEVNVRVEDNPEMDTTAYNDGKNIVFNAHLLEEVDDRTITSLHGFNYHEVAHVLFSPRGGSVFGTAIRHEGLKHAYNVLEDSRIERLLTAKYPSTANFLEASMLEYLLKGNADEFASYFPLITGRKYLDIELRQEIADRFIKTFGVDVAERVATIVHEYRTLIYPRDFERGLTLVRAFADIVGREDITEQNGTPMIPKGGGGHIDRDVQDKGRMANKRDQEDTDKRAEGSDKSPTEKLDNPSNGTGFDDNNDPAEQNADSEGGTGFDDNKDDDSKTIKDAINDRLDKIIKSDEVKRDTKDIKKAIQSNGDKRNAIKQGAYTNQSVTPKVQASARAFGVALERIRIDNDPAWELETDNGRLNVQRAMRSDINDINKLFDRWHEGNSNNDIEAIILVDSSGSMGWQMERTMETAWVIKRGIERINGRVAVYKFNHNSRLIYGANDKASPTQYRYVNSSGGTNPYKALLEARRLLTGSRRGVRIAFIITDGQWDMTEQNNAIINELNKEGVMTACVYLGNLRYWKDQDRDYYDRMVKELRHDAQVFRAIEEPTDLIGLAKELVRRTMGTRH